jgi:hypothetical protein
VQFWCSSWGVDSEVGKLGFQPGGEDTTPAKMCMRVLSWTRHAAWCCRVLLDGEKATFARSLAQYIYLGGPFGGEEEIAFLRSLNIGNHSAF